MWAQGRLKLTTEQFTVLLQLADFWWDAGEPPFPTKELLAGRMGRDRGKCNGIKRVPRYRGPGNQIANGYDMTPLVKKLVALESEFRKMIERKRNRRQKVEAKAS